MNQPEIVAAAPVADKHNLLPIGRKARLAIPRRPARQALRIAAGRGHQVQIAQQIEYDLLSVRRNIYGHPRSFIRRKRHLASRLQRQRFVFLLILLFVFLLVRGLRLILLRPRRGRVRTGTRKNQDRRKRHPNHPQSPRNRRIENHSESLPWTRISAPRRCATLDGTANCNLPSQWATPVRCHVQTYRRANRFHEVTRFRTRCSVDTKQRRPRHSVWR